MACKGNSTEKAHHLVALQNVSAVYGTLSETEFFTCSLYELLEAVGRTLDMNVSDRAPSLGCYRAHRDGLGNSEPSRQLLGCQLNVHC